MNESVVKGGRRRGEGKRRNRDGRARSLWMRAPAGAEDWFERPLLWKWHTSYHSGVLFLQSL